MLNSPFSLMQAKSIHKEFPIFTIQACVMSGLIDMCNRPGKNVVGHFLLDLC